MARGKIPVEVRRTRNGATGGVIGEYRDMDKGEKIDCGANAEVVF
jgi:hypothetical protein